MEADYQGIEVPDTEYIWTRAHLACSLGRLEGLPFPICWQVGTLPLSTPHCTSLLPYLHLLTYQYVYDTGAMWLLDDKRDIVSRLHLSW